MRHRVISDGLPHAMSTGALVIKPNISRFSRTGVSFEDATRVENLDAVIFCTGYNISFKFLDQTVVPIKDNEVKLYKHVFPPHHRHPSLAIIGLVQSSGSFNPAAELQARWAVKVFQQATKAAVQGRNVEWHLGKEKAVEVNVLPFQKADPSGMVWNIWLNSKIPLRILTSSTDYRLNSNYIEQC